MLKSRKHKIVFKAKIKHINTSSKILLIEDVCLFEKQTFHFI